MYHTFQTSARLRPGEFMGLLIPFVLLPYFVLFVLLLAWYDGEDSHDVCTELDFPLDNPLTLITYI